MDALRIFFFGMMVVISMAADETDKPKVETLTEKSYVNENGYNFAYKTSDGVSRQEEGSLITVGENQGIGIKGSYSYVAPDGQEYQVTFTADQNGYKPQIKVVSPSSQ